MQAANAYKQSQMPTNPYADPPQNAQMKPPQGPYGYVGNPPPPAHHAQHYPNRTRMPYNASDSIPLQLKRLAMEMQEGNVVGKSMTPVLKRDDQTRAWERRQGGGNDLSRKVSLRHHPALDLLTQQAELGYRVGGGRQPVYQPYSPRHTQQSFPATNSMDASRMMPIEQPQLAHTLQQGAANNPQYAQPQQLMGPPPPPPTQQLAQPPPSLYDSSVEGRDLGMYTPLQASNISSVSPRSAQQPTYSQPPPAQTDPASLPYTSPPQGTVNFWQGRSGQHPQNSPMWP